MRFFRGVGDIGVVFGSDLLNICQLRYQFPLVVGELLAVVNRFADLLNGNGNQFYRIGLFNIHHADHREEDDYGGSQHTGKGNRQSLVLFAVDRKQCENDDQEHDHSVAAEETDSQTADHDQSDIPFSAGVELFDVPEDGNRKYQHACTEGNVLPHGEAV